MITKKSTKSLIKKAAMDNDYDNSEGESNKAENHNDIYNLQETDEDEDEVNGINSGTDGDDLSVDKDVSDADTDSDENLQEKKTKADIIREILLEKYKQRYGMQLFLRFPHKTPATDEELQIKVKQLSPLIIKAHKPRQKYANFCLIDFKNKEDRDLVFKELKKSIKSGQLNKYVVAIPHTESMEFINKIIDRKIQSNERKKAKSRLNKATKKSQEKKFTSTIVLTNLPKTATNAQLRKLFPNAVDIKMKTSIAKLKNSDKVAAITLPSTIDARKFVKQTIFLSGVKLQIRFDLQRIKKQKSSICKAGKKFNKQREENVSQTKLCGKNV
uniref:RRM domain-containing protein n=1 Tax=Glossina austeni TaxID=7395 RepID=A0A1A9UTR7_GLOAU